MSFILDALQKSETERHGKSLPSLADVPIRPRRTERPWWIFAVAGLLFVNLAVLAIVLLRGSKAPEPQAVVASNATSAAAPAQPPRRRVRILRDTSEAGREFAEQAGAMMADDPSSAQTSFDPAADAEQMRAAASVPPGPPMVQPIEGPRVEPPRTSLAGSAGPTPAATAPASAPSAASPPASGVPTIGELTAKGMVLPEMHVDLHVYAPNPAGRFVFINKQKYLEGQTLREGPVVVQITPDGVELDNGGTRFMLPRQ